MGQIGLVFQFWIIYISSHVVIVKFPCGGGGGGRADRQNTEHRSIPSLLWLNNERCVKARKNDKNHYFLK